MSELDRLLLPVFARQHWLANRGDLRAAGGSDRQAGYRVAIGAWEVADDGVWRLVGPAPTWFTRVLAPILSIDGLRAASFHCAAAVHGIDGYGRGVPEISVARRLRTVRRDDVRVHTSTDLERCHRPTVDGIPVTDLGRTVLDLARTESDARVLRAIEWSRRHRGLEWSDVIRSLSHHARKGRPGVRRLRRVILANMAREEVTDSDFELLVLSLLRQSGLREPVLHHKVEDGGRFVAEVDLAYPDLKIAIELDGRVHLDPRVRERDLQRQNDLVLSGWVVLRFTWERFRANPDAVVAEIRAAIAARALAV